MDAITQGGEIPTLIKRMRAMEAEIAGYEAKLAQLQEDERKELLQRVNATVAAEQIQSLRTDTDPLLPARKITMRYLVKDNEQKARIIFKGGKSIDMNRDILPA